MGKTRAFHLTEYDGKTQTESPKNHHLSNNTERAKTDQVLS